MATFTSKTLIPGQTPIGQNRDGSYIYEEVMSKATTAPKATTPIYTPPTAIAKIPTDGKTNFMPLVTPENARKPNAPVKDSLGIAKKVNEADERVKQLKQHFQYLEQNGEFYLNDKQSDYIKKFKQKYPDYSSVPDVSLYSKIILAEPKAMQTYGNIGERTAGDKFRDITMGNIEALGDALGEGYDAWKNASRGGYGSETEVGLGTKVMNEGAAVASGLGKFAEQVFLNGGANVINALPEFGGPNDTFVTKNKDGTERIVNEKRGTTSVSEAMALSLPEDGKKASELTKGTVDILKGEGYSDKKIKEIIDTGYFQDLFNRVQNDPEMSAKFEETLNISNLLPGIGKSDDAIRNKIIADLSEKGIKKFNKMIANDVFKSQTKGKIKAGIIGAGKRFADDVARGIEETQSYIDNAPERSAEAAADPKVIEKNTAKNREVLDGIKDTITGKKILAKADDFGNDPKDDIARYEDFQPEIDEDGRVHTDRAVENVETKYIAPKGKTVRSLIEAEGKRVSLEEFRAKTLKEIESNIDDIVNYDDWVKYINKSIDSAKKFVDENGTIALEKIDDIKKKVQSQNKYLNPNDTANKALARGARKMIEENVESADIAALNKEIARFYAIRDYLEAIGTGKTIKGGRLGKYSSKFGGQFIGAVAGGLIGGPAGAVVGGAAAGEAADIIKGKLLSSAIKSTGAIGVPESEAFAAARGTLDEAPKLLEGPSGNPTSYPSIYSREAEQLGRGEFPGNNNTQLGDFATPKSVTPVVSGPGSSLAVSVDNGTIDIKKALEQFDKLNPEEKAKALNGSDKLRELVKVTTEIKDIQEFKGDFGYTPPEIIDSLGDNYLNYSPEAKEIIRKGLDKEDLATLQKMNREKAGLPEPVVEEKAKVTETKELPKKVTDLEEEIGMLDDNKGDRSSFVQKYDGSDEYGTAGDAYDAVKDMDRFEFEDYASLWKDKDGGGMIPKNETASKIIDDIDGFADKLGISSDGAITLIRDGTGGSRYKENLANFKARYGVAPFQAKKKLAQFKKAWEAGKNPSIDDFLYKSEKTVDFSKPSKEEMAIENSKTPFDDDPVSPLAKKEPTTTETIEEVVTPVKDTPELPKTPQEGKTVIDEAKKYDTSEKFVIKNKQSDYDNSTFLEPYIGKEIEFTIGNGQRVNGVISRNANGDIVGIPNEKFTLRHNGKEIESNFDDFEVPLNSNFKLNGHSVRMKDGGFLGDEISKDIYKQSKPKPSLPLSQKSEVKYSKPDLVSEAKKYKSAEEFVKAQGHGRKIIPLRGESMADNTYKLSEVLDNKKLFEKYPELSGFNVKFGWTRVGKEKMAIEGRNIVVTKSQYETIPDTNKLAEIDKKLNELYKKDELGTITKEEYKTAENLQQKYDDIKNGKGAIGIRLTDEGMRSLYHEIQHGKQGLKGYKMKQFQEDFLSKNAMGDSKDYYQDKFEIDARMAEKKYKTIDELMDVWNKANKK